MCMEPMKSLRPTHRGLDTPDGRKGQRAIQIWAFIKLWKWVKLQKNQAGFHGKGQEQINF